MSDEDLKEVLRGAIAGHPEGVAAGPKALLIAVKAADSRFESVGIHKIKKLVKDLKPEFEANSNSNANGKAQMGNTPSKPVGSKDDCPGAHGLTRFLTDHASFCCDVCRCYLPEGAAMWGCRKCDWDVCEARCHVKQETLPDLDTACAALEKRFQDLKLEYDRTRMACLEAEVHKLEKRLDSCSAAELAKHSPIVIGEEDARLQKKSLLKRSEALLEQIDGCFKAEKIKQKEEAGEPVTAP